MSKPMELRVFPKDGTYEHNDAFTVYLLPGGGKECAGTACALPSQKRLTDAELAAEFHFARLDSRVRDARQQYSPSDVNWHHYLKGLGQEAAFERFATSPHHDEAEQ